MFKIIECKSTETHNIYPNLNHQQQFRLNKSMKLNIIFLQRLEKEN